ncbi:DUF3604 domain-containing protein [Parasphingorhabdus sp.]|uniref:DUF3604 domain-containing protein n=1 Tax=Parasphingorhabdus sp. TaxID=2709688 RepID=UPI0032651BA0
MRKVYWVGLAALVVAVVGYFYVQYRLSQPFMSEEDIAELKADIAAQDETAFAGITQQPIKYQEANPERNVYFGDLHGHSDLSFDSYIFGNRLSLDQSYRFAKGESLKNPGGELMQLSIPLDFAAMTDHAEGFGMHELCGGSAKNEEGADFCKRLENPDANLFLELREQGEQRPPESSLAGYLNGEKTEAQLAALTWKNIVAIAEKHNDPGKFTTFAAYEYSPPLPNFGKMHRNVIFRNSTVPRQAVSAMHARTELDLWDSLLRDCVGPCEFLTIPHNPNKSWGLAFASHTIDGDQYTIDDWRQRKQVEPIVEMYQIKGNSECSIGFGTSDEECGFEQFLPRCTDGQETGCISETSMARDGLKKGLVLEEENGVNPFRFGMVGSTDTHNSSPGDTEERDFRGVTGIFNASAKTRLSAGRDGEYGTLKRNPGGLAAIWAEDNTREALFDAMQRKEVYATSGTRIRLRFFASFNYRDNLPNSVDALKTAYKVGAPMGGSVNSVAGQVPSFFIWAMRDPLDAPLDKVQVVKGWIENGETKEAVQDILCSGGRAIDPRTKRCPATKATVSLKDCSIDQTQGATELKTLWTDRDFRAEQNAFYYVRVIQNPTCRWSTYDSLRLGQAPPTNAPATITEMAWSSPIWIDRPLADR